jgi:hypothetical protein
MVIYDEIPMEREQRRARRIAMTDSERSAFLREQHTCRVATVGKDGAPHVVPLWFAWDGASLWLNSIVRSQRWTDLMRDPRVSIVVDAGELYGELRGVELIGRMVPVGEAPRRMENGDPATEEPERLFAEKYGGFGPDGRHAWLRLEAEKIVSWDFRKLADR